MATDEICVQVLDSLKDGPYACLSLEKLSGGTANFVYRGTLKTPLQGGVRTVVVKHTEGYVASNPGFKLAESRSNYEQTILTALDHLPATTTAGITITTPHLHNFSPSANTQIYTDLPSSSDIKTYCLTHALTQPQCRRLGAALGFWTHHFHAWAAAPEQADLREKMRGNVAMRELKFMLNYTTLVGKVDEFPGILGGLKAVFGEVEASVRRHLDEGGELIHGDFWSGNVLLPNAPFPAPEEPLKFFVIDWELSHLSSRAFDLGQMFAELFELKHFRGIEAGFWLIETFMEGYGKVEDDLAFKTAIHAGTHLVCWGSTVRGWGKQEQVNAVVEIGRDWIVKGWEKDKRFFEGTALGCLFT